MLNFEKLHVGYNKILFEADNLELQKGQLISLIGPNGSGKTTFLNTLLGVTKPISGEIQVNDELISTLKHESRVKLFSHVSSKFDGVSHLTVYELIAMGRAPYTNILNQLSSKDKKVIKTIIKRLNIGFLVNSSTTLISDGERQIAMIGKAMAQETECIILDEPTAFLDYPNRLKVIRILKEIALEENKLIIISTHNIEICLEFSDLILAVDNKSKQLRIYKDNVTKEQLISEVFHI